MHTSSSSLPLPPEKRGGAKKTVHRGEKGSKKEPASDITKEKKWGKKTSQKTPLPLPQIPSRVPGVPERSPGSCIAATLDVGHLRHPQRLLAPPLPTRLRLFNKPREQLPRLASRLSVPDGRSLSHTTETAVLQQIPIRLPTNSTTVPTSQSNLATNNKDTKPKERKRQSNLATNNKDTKLKERKKKL